MLTTITELLLAGVTQTCVPSGDTATPVGVMLLPKLMLPVTNPVDVLINSTAVAETAYAVAPSGENAIA